jgi:hypothetical protein
MKGFISICTVLFFVICNPIHANDLNYLTPTLAIKGSAMISKSADQIEIAFDAMTENKDPKRAVEDNNEIMNRALQNLQTIGLIKDDYYTSNYQLQAIYRSKDNYSGEQILDHYTVHHTLTIKTKKIDLSEAIIGAAIEAGINQIQSINFTNSNAQTNREEALEQAVKNGLSNARVVANAAGTKIVRVLSLTVDQVENNNPRVFDHMSLAKWSGFNPPIQAGPVEIQAEVNMIFEIASK